MTFAAFFLLGIPMALLANYLIGRFGAPVLSSEPDDDDDDHDESVQLPWQRGAGPDRVRWFFAALVPVLAGAAGTRFDPLPALAVSLLVTALLVCTATDLMRYRVPNAITYPGTALALLAALLLPDADIVSAIAAAIVGALVFLVLAFVTRGGMGLGDVKLAMLIGAGLGLPAAYQALVIGVMVGGLMILALLMLGLVSRKQAVPYAPFLALAAVAVVLLQGGSFAQV